MHCFFENYSAVVKTLQICWDWHECLWNRNETDSHTHQLESSQDLVVLGHLPLSLADHDLYRGLAVRCRGEGLEDAAGEDDWEGQDQIEQKSGQ